MLKHKAIKKTLLGNFLTWTVFCFIKESLHQAVDTQEKLKIKCILAVSKKKLLDLYLFFKALWWSSWYRQGTLRLDNPDQAGSSLCGVCMFSSCLSGLDG